MACALNFRSRMTGCVKSESCSSCAKTKGKVVIGVAFAVLATFAILGLLQTSGHLNLSNSASWLSTALDKVGHQAAFGVILAGAVAIPLIILGVQKMRSVMKQQKLDGAETERNPQQLRQGSARLHRVYEDILRPVLAQEIAAEKELSEDQQQELFALDTRDLERLQKGTVYKFQEYYRIQWIKSESGDGNPLQSEDSLVTVLSRLRTVKGKDLFIAYLDAQIEHLNPQAV